jgi:hypothetical protein
LRFLRRSIPALRSIVGPARRTATAAPKHQTRPAPPVALIVKLSAAYAKPISGSIVLEIRPGGRRLLQCARAHEAQLSADCRAALETVEAYRNARPH